MTSLTSLENLRVTEAPEKTIDWSRPLRSNKHREGQPSLSELVDTLIASLEGADKAVADKAEAVLTRVGRPAIPALLQGLRSPHSRVKSVCTMVLIRIGQPVVEDLRKFYLRYASADLRWVAEFILNELGAQALPVPKKERAGAQHNGMTNPILNSNHNVLPFSKTPAVL